MKASIAIAQLPITWDLHRNLAAISSLLTDTRPDEIVVLPEGALSGYGTDLSSLDHLPPSSLALATDRLAKLARDRAIHLFCGTLLHEHGVWSNAALYFAPDGSRWTYRKINLAMNERGRLVAGSELPTLPIQLSGGESVTLGVQICREIRFPEQWQHLAEHGAQAFIYLTHAANPTEPAGVWRSHLISRAAENQRFVLAANVADPGQHCPSMAISPRGEVLAEAPAGQTALIRTTVDFDESADWYLGQRRQDLLKSTYRGPAHHPR
ncbi:carbon-nitrogen hydrolase family protein [Streptomyces sp. SID14478]|nr:carbon-nitrogen hydrolase family protein [Streptomyces sp. SID14478]NEB74685.1 carbon-nitrogen hydrolase family protein [Streptomyces sp. SID14478]